MEDHQIGELWKSWMLARLFAKRPRSQDLSIDDVSAETGVCPEVEPDEFFDDVITWLVGEGLIADGQRAEGQAFNVRLTSQGLGMMLKQEAGWTADAGVVAMKALKGVPSALVSGGVGMAFAALKARYGI